MMVFIIIKHHFKFVYGNYINILKLEYINIIINNSTTPQGKKMHVKTSLKLI